MSPFDWAGEAFSLRVAITLLHFVWQGLTVAAIVLLSGRILQKSSARVRYAINVAGLVAMLACLPVTYAVIDVPDDAHSEDPLLNNRHASSARSTLALPMETLAEVDPGVAQLATNNGAVSAAVVPSTPSDSRAVTAATNSPKAPAATSGAGTVVDRALAEHAPLLVLTYLAGVFLMTLRLGTGVWGGHRLRLRSAPCDDSWIASMVRSQAQLLGLRTAPMIAVCREISIPVVVGIVRPVIVLPASLATGLSSDQLQALLTHELAHIRRHDLLVNMLQRLIEAVLFFHPAVWFISRRVSTERENIADDMVIASGWEPARYADALVRMAELASSLRSSRLTSQVATLAASGNSSSEFRRRVLRLLEKAESPQLRLTRSGFLAVVLIAASLLTTPVILQSREDEPRPEPRPAASPADSDTEAESGSPSQRTDARAAYAELAAADHWRSRRDAARKLAAFGTAGQSLLLEGTRHESEDVRVLCFEFLQKQFPKDPKTIDAIIATLKQKPDSERVSRIRYSGAFHLGSYDISRGADVLREMLKSDKDLRLTAAKSLAQLGDSSVIMILYDHLGSNRYMERYQANIGIKALTGKDLNDFGDYDWSEGAFVSGGVEANIIGRSPQKAELTAARFTAIAAFHTWLQAEKPVLAALLDPGADQADDQNLAETVIECHVRGGGESVVGAKVTVRLTQAVDPNARFTDMREGKTLKELTYTTGDDGRYRIVVPGSLATTPGLKVSVSVSHPDFLDRVVGPVLLTDFEMQRIDNNQPAWLHRQLSRRAVLTTRLRAGQQVEGRVLLWDGTPAIGATVKTATKYQPYSWKFHSADDYGASASTTTDQDGRFKLETDQRSTLTVSQPGHPILLIDNLPQFMELADADSPLTFRISRGVRLRGHVLSDLGTPLARVIVTARRQFAWNEFDMPLSYRLSCVSNEHGEYQFPPLPADDYKLRASAALAADADIEEYNAHISGVKVVGKTFETLPLEYVFVPTVQTLSADNQLPVFDLRASPMATVRVKVEFPHGAPDPNRSNDVGIAGRINGNNWQGQYVKADESGFAVLRAPKGLDGMRIKTGLALHRRSPDADVEIGQAVHFGTLKEDLDGITVIKPKYAKLKVKLTLPEELSRHYSQSKSRINISARHARDGFTEHSPKKQKFWLVGSSQSGTTAYYGTAIPNEPLVLTVSVKTDGETTVLHEQELTLTPGEERLVAVAIGDAAEDAEAARRKAAEETQRRAAGTVTKSVAYLLAQQKNDGSWRGNGQRHVTGTTALVALSLLDAGLAADHEALQRATDFLIPQTSNQTKEVALQALYLRRVGEQGRLVCLRNLKWLVDAQLKSGSIAGAWPYQTSTPVLSHGDMANTAFAVRALCELAGTDKEFRAVVPDEVLTTTARLLVTSQQQNGGWAYTPRSSQVTASMTVCMLGSLKGIKRLVPDIDVAATNSIQKATNWLDKHWDVRSNVGSKGWHLFYLGWLPFAVGDSPHVGEHDWYQEIVTHVSPLQRDDGSFTQTVGDWHPLYATAYAVQVLSHTPDPAKPPAAK